MTIIGAKIISEEMGSRNCAEEVTESTNFVNRGRRVVGTFLQVRKYVLPAANARLHS
jgi:hypothetical protein